MSTLLYESLDTVGGWITSLNIENQGHHARVDPGQLITVKGTVAAQNPACPGGRAPTDQIHIVLLLDDTFWKCVYNDVPSAKPQFTRASFSFKTYAPTEKKVYKIRAGWGFNWPWPQDTVNFLLAHPEKLETVGSLTVGPVPKVVSYLPLVLTIGAPTATVIGLAIISKKGRI